MGPAHGQVRLTRSNVTGTHSTLKLTISWLRNCVSAEIAQVKVMREQTKTARCCTHPEL